VDQWLAPGAILDLGEREVRVLYTPGHTEDSVSLLDIEAGMIFTGDFIYPGPLYAFLSNSGMRDYLQGAQTLLAATPTGTPDLVKVASQLGMSKRTLQRKLAEKDIVFSDLVESISRTIAMDYVQHTDYSLTDVALMLGYAELSSFSRAFKRWSGVSPQQAREAGAAPI
jgi:AraC-like DNA-binding protein